MSIVKQALARCSRCGHEHEIPIYKSVNTAEDSGMEARVLDGSLFLWTCPDCGARNLVSYECLYHDPEKRRMLWLLPHGRIRPSEMESIARHAASLGGYTLRLCSNLGELIEKILILNAGLDDVVIEICKYVVKGEWAQQGSGPSATDPAVADAASGEAGPADVPLHFHRLDGDNLIFSYPAAGRMMSLSLGRNVYDDAAGILARNPSLQPEDGFRRIDAAWLATVIA